MLKLLSIANFAVVSEATIELDDDAYKALTAAV